MIRTEMVKFNDNLYVVKRKFSAEVVRVDKVQELRQLLQCDIVLKQNGWLFYCELIPEAELVSE